MNLKGFSVFLLWLCFFVVDGAADDFENELDVLLQMQSDDVDCSVCGEYSDGCSENEDLTIKCNCKDNFVQKEDVCEADCDACGTHSNGCSANEDFTIKCDCKDNFVQKEGECEADCDVCGTYSNGCTANEDHTIKCNCKANFVQKEGACEADCDVCGTHSNGCSANEDFTIKCDCKDNFLQNDGECEADCGVCGTHSNGCTANEDDAIICDCKDNFVEKEGICEVNCDVCGPNSEGCVGNDDHSITCECKENFKQNGSTCKECLCKENEECSFDKGKKICACKSGYSKNKDVCTLMCDDSKNQCQNGGECISIEDHMFCECKSGTSGDLCQIVDICKENASFCGKNEDAKCVFDQKLEKAVCKCDVPEKYFDSLQAVCRKPCATDSDCKHNASCKEDPTIKGKKFCRCKSGTLGDTCNVVKACFDGIVHCGTEKAQCVWDENEKDRAKCVCKNDKFIYDASKKECIANCSVCGVHSTGCDADEEDAIKCRCEDNYLQIGDRCEANCGCGPHSTGCTEDDGIITCICKEHFTQIENRCEADCSACGPHSKGCTGNDDSTITCQCNESYQQNGVVCEACDCGKNGKCSFFDGKKDCTCESTYGFDGDKCVECNCGAESSGCSFKEGKKTCSCNSGFVQWENKCKACDCGKHGTCSFDDKGNAKCECDKGFAVRNDKCHETCSKEKGCQNGGTCTESFCVCPTDITGDLCDTLGPCKKLEEICHKAGAKCEYDTSNQNEAKCVCTNPEYVFDEKNKACKPKWCEPNPCSSDSKCKFEKGVGFCECDKAEMYYNYASDKCEAFDQCLLKPPCKENEVCSNGECICIQNYEKHDNKCVSMQCSKQNPCFAGADCVETEIPGIVKCICENKKFYDGNKCVDGSCFLPDYRKNCTADCPKGFVKNDNGECVPEDEKKRCEKDCNYGICVKEGDEELCKCIPNFTKSVNNTCILDASVVCASNKLTADSSKCDCSGAFTYAENGITCEKKSCAEEAVQEECLKAAAAECKDEWKSTKPYDCSCGKGYSKNSEGYCTEKCQLDQKIMCMEEGKSCYINEEKEAKCLCPPPLMWNEQTKKCNNLDENIFMVQNLPVFKKKYARNDKSVDKVSLNSDIILSMQQMFKNLDYSYLFHYVGSDDILNCSVILKFSKNGKSEIKRFEMQKRIEINCTDCDENLSLLPPKLFLHSSSVMEVKDDQVNLCYKPITDSLCGKYADCKNNQCSCRKGFKISDYSINKNEAFTILRCEDVDECSEDSHTCSETRNSTCVNTIGDYYCKCLPGFKKSNENFPYKGEEDKEACVDLCTPNPCKKGKCVIKDQTFDCSCDLGYIGAFCNREDIALKKANTNIKVVGAVLGTLLAVAVILFVAYLWRKKTNSYSEDFSPSSQHVDNSEMRDRRPMRGVANKAYE